MGHYFWCGISLLFATICWIKAKINWQFTFLYSYFLFVLSCISFCSHNFWVPVSGCGLARCVGWTRRWWRVRRGSNVSDEGEMRRGKRCGETSMMSFRRLGKLIRRNYVSEFMYYLGLVNFLANMGGVFPSFLFLLSSFLCPFNISKFL